MENTNEKPIRKVLGFVRQAVEMKLPGVESPGIILRCPYCYCSRWKLYFPDEPQVFHIKCGACNQVCTPSVHGATIHKEEVEELNETNPSSVRPEGQTERTAEGTLGSV